MTIIIDDALSTPILIVNISTYNKPSDPVTESSSDLYNIILPS